jgi:hypothetical protein
MRSHTLILGSISLIAIAAAGLWAVPGKINDGTSDAKFMLNIDPSVALLLDIKADDLKQASVNIDFAELKGKYAGVLVSDYQVLKDIFDLNNLDHSVTAETHDVATSVHILSAAKAVELGLIDKNDLENQNDIYVLAMGAKADVIIDLFDTAKVVELTRPSIASYFASDVFDSMPTAETVVADHVMRNGHDTAAAEAS